MSLAFEADSPLDQPLGQDAANPFLERMADILNDGDAPIRHQH